MPNKISPIFYSGIFSLTKIIGGFILVKMVAIISGPQGIVAFGQVQSFISALNGFVSAPLGSGLVKHTAENFDGDNISCAPWWRASLAWTSLLFLIISIPTLFYSLELSEYFFKSKNYQLIIIAILFSIPLSAFTVLIPSILNGQLKYKRYAAVGIISSILSTLISILILYFYQSNYGVIIAAISLSATNGAFMIFLIRDQEWLKLMYWLGYFKKSHIKDMGKYILMAVTSSICSPLTLMFIRNQLIESEGWELAGYWQAVYRISEVYLSLITITFSTYFLPILSRTKGTIQLFEELKKMFNIILPLTILMGISIYIFRLYIIEIAFSKDFIEAENLFKLQLIGDVIKICGWMLAYTIIAKGFFRLYIFSEIFFSIVFIGFSKIFIELYGISGANIAYLINYILYFLFLLICIIIFNRKHAFENI